VYEQLTATQVQSRLEDLTPAQQRKVRDYEQRNANRKTVLAAIESKLAASLAHARQRMSARRQRDVSETSAGRGLLRRVAAP
jgi:hypothetical protein